jgi:transposase-like protein
MPDIPLQFPWQVAEGGYRWVESHAIGDPDRVRRPFLTDGRPIGAGGFRVMQYLPLSAFSGLFRVFADTEPNHNGIKAFADRFGPLGDDIAQPISLNDQPNAKGVPLGTGEPLAAWNQEILIMRFAIDIWEAARNGDVGRLEQVIAWREDGSGVQILSHPELPNGQLPQAPARVERTWIAGTHLGDDVLGRFVRGDLVRPALHYVQSTINKSLEGRASPRLLWDAKRERLGLYIVPGGLIGALWLQFARAVERDSRFRECAECGIWFELAPGTARADKLYCSTPCRTKAYRKRQAEAVLLHGEGRSINDIARELESDPDTVRGWIERKRASAAAPQSETE